VVNFVNFFRLPDPAPQEN